MRVRGRVHRVTNGEIDAKTVLLGDRKLRAAVNGSLESTVNFHNTLACRNSSVNASIGEVKVGTFSKITRAVVADVRNRTSDVTNDITSERTVETLGFDFEKGTTQRVAVIGDLDSFPPLVSSDKEPTSVLSRIKSTRGQLDLQTRDSR